MIRIPTRTHGIIDYVTGTAMLAAPLLIKRRNAEFSMPPQSVSEGTVLAAMGATVLAQSLMTDYEGGVMKVIDMPVHLSLDVAAGVLLAASPWIFNMNPRARLPLAVLGLGIAALGLLTNINAGDEDFVDEIEEYLN